MMRASLSAPHQQTVSVYRAVSRTSLRLTDSGQVRYLEGNGERLGNSTRGIPRGRTDRAGAVAVSGGNPKSISRTGSGEAGGGVRAGTDSITSR